MRTPYAPASVGAQGPSPDADAPVSLDGPKAQVDGQEDDATATTLRILSAASAFGPKPHRRRKGRLSQRLFDTGTPQGEPVER
jgi:hypothetical protein